ncbi:hypothetical protein CS369_09535 [Candidatus Symbiopectobacterium sp. 'North America']|nr:hypothetical protein [Candidatus Symbiopectobacterium sp. 'North America']
MSALTHKLQIRLVAQSANALQKIHSLPWGDIPFGISIPARLSINIAKNKLFTKNAVLLTVSFLI